MKLICWFTMYPAIAVPKHHYQEKKTRSSLFSGCWGSKLKSPLLHLGPKLPLLPPRFDHTGPWHKGWRVCRGKVNEGSHRGAEIGSLKVETCTPTSVYPSSPPDRGVKYFITPTAITQHWVKSNDMRKLHVRHWEHSLCLSNSNKLGEYLLHPWNTPFQTSAFTVSDPKQMKRDTRYTESSGDKRSFTAKQLNGRICPVKHTTGYP